MRVNLLIDSDMNVMVTQRQLNPHIDPKPTIMRIRRKLSDQGKKRKAKNKIIFKCLFLDRLIRTIECHFVGQDQDYILFASSSL